ncbi:MAG: hypothetical protein ACJ77K_05025 [Bacteroidia bacterium]
MDYIGKRISIKRKEAGETSIVILSTTGKQDKVKKIIFFLAFVLWTLSGIVVLTQYFLLRDQQQRVMIIVWMGFWAYFEYRIFKGMMWRNSGMEKIRLKERKLYYKRDVGGRGKISIYDFDFIKDLRVIEPKEGFFEQMNDSYWVISGEKIAFDYYGKEVKLGIQLEPEDAKALHKLVRSKM